LTILESKGYVSTNARKLLKTAGYAETREGFQRYLNDQASARAHA